MDGVSFISITGVISALLALMIIFEEAGREGGLGTAGVANLLLCIAPTMTIMIAALGGARAVLPDGDGELTFIAQED